MPGILLEYLGILFGKAPWKDNKFAKVFYGTIPERNFYRMFILAAAGIAVDIGFFAASLLRSHIFLAVMNPGTVLFFKILPLNLVTVFLALMLIMYLSLKSGNSSAKSKGMIAHIVTSVFVAGMPVIFSIEIILDNSLYSFITASILLIFVPVFRRRSAAAYIFSLGALCICTIYLCSAFFGSSPGLYPIFTVIVSVISYLAWSAQNTRIVTGFISAAEAAESRKHLENANVQLQELNAELETLSTTDQLTGINNRRAFDEYIERTWNECKRSRQPMTVIMMDIDRFKRYNDTFGHLKGDECLRKVAECVKGFLNRSVDMFARYGGEEFVAVLPFTSGDSVITLAERIRAAVENLKIPHPKNDSVPYVTLSMGIASRYTYQAETHSVVTQLSDEALYAAKSGGRNRAVADISLEADVFELKRQPSPGVNPLEDLALLRTVSKLAGCAFHVDLTTRKIVFSPEITDIIDIEDPAVSDVYELLDLTHEDDRLLFMETFDNLFNLSSGLPSSREFRIKKKGGGFRTIWAKTEYIYNESHEPVAAAGILNYRIST